MVFEWPGANSDDPIYANFATGETAHIECATWGAPPSEAPTFLLLHEGLGCIALWRDFPQRLSKATGCGVVTYSRLGYGRSSGVSPPLPITRMADEACDVLPPLIEMIAPQSLIIVGHSDGGTIAAHYLSGEPHQSLLGAVLLSPHFYCEPSNVSAIRETSAAFETTNLRSKLGKYHDDADGAFHGWAQTWLDPAFAQWDMRRDLNRWRHPVLFVQGRNDPYGSEGQAAAAAAAPSTEIVWLDECAHSPHLEQSVETIDLIGGFLAKITSDTP